MSPDDAPSVVVVTGVQASGKSTVARLLAARFSRGAHVEADALHRFIVSGAAWAREPGEPTGEVARQLQLRLHLACLVTRSFVSAGFSVVLDDIILGSRWTELQDELAGIAFETVVLAPSVDAVIARDAARAKSPLGEDWARYLDQVMRETMAEAGIWVDSTALTPDETVDAIVARLRRPPR